MDTAAIVVAIVALVFSVMAVLGATTAQSANDRLRLIRIERRLDRIIAHLDIPEDTTIPEPIRAELLKGDKVKAIKLYREQHGVGLKEAKDAVEQMMETM